MIGSWNEIPKRNLLGHINLKRDRVRDWGKSGGRRIVKIVSGQNQAAATGSRQAPDAVIDGFPVAAGINVVLVLRHGSVGIVGISKRAAVNVGVDGSGI